MNFKVVYGGQYVAWVSVLIPSYQDAIIAGMVKKGYSIGIVSNSGTIADSSEGKAATLLSFRIETYKNDVGAKEIFKDLMEIMTANKFYYYSIIITILSDSSFIGSNIIVPGATAIEAKADKPKSN